MGRLAAPVPAGNNLRPFCYWYESDGLWWRIGLRICFDTSLFAAPLTLNLAASFFSKNICSNHYTSHNIKKQRVLYLLLLPIPSISSSSNIIVAIARLFTGLRDRAVVIGLFCSLSASKLFSELNQRRIAAIYSLLILRACFSTTMTPLEAAALEGAKVAESRRSGD